MPWARDMASFAPVARRELPSSVPKNQYSTAISSARKISAVKMGLFRPMARTLRWLTIRAYLVTLMPWLALISMMAKLMEYRDSWVRMPARMGGMPMAVWNTPVSRPASIPAKMAHSSASHTFTPLSISITQTAPPVAMLPSTVRSARSSTL